MRGGYRPRRFGCWSREKASGASVIIGNPLAGWLSDRLGRRPMSTPFIANGHYPVSRRLIFNRFGQVNFDV